MGELTIKEYDIIHSLKEKGVLQKFTIEELKSITKNGGIAIICGDGDIDVRRYHSRIKPNRPHSIMVFGGPLVFAPSFRGYKKSLVQDLIENMRWGMEAKATRSVFLYFHYPCGVAAMFHYSIEEVINLAPEVVSVFKQHFKPNKIHTFFHARRRNKGGNIEQNTYKLIIPVC